VRPVIDSVGRQDLRLRQRVAVEDVGSGTLTLAVGSSSFCSPHQFRNQVLSECGEEEASLD
jgi:hypothetical protein